MQLLGQFKEAIEYLEQTKARGIKPGLERVQKLLAHFADPQNRVPAIHIAGTNGKGSTSSFCAHILAAADHRVGWFTSPYLERFNERIRVIDGREGLRRFVEEPISAEISETEFRKILSEVVAVALNSADLLDDAPTEFELLTAVAFIYFARQECDFMVIETGLGGRLDSTNVIDRPAATIITAIDYDHCDRLGDTLPQIAAEKAGIIKPNCPVYLYDQELLFDLDGGAKKRQPNSESAPRLVLASSNECGQGQNEAVDQDKARAERLAAQAVITAKAKECNAPLTIVSTASFKCLRSDKFGQSFCWQNTDYHTKLVGDYQVVNAVLALSACDNLVPQTALSQGIAQTTWAGRLEYLQHDPDLLIDGAHNLQGCRSLAKFLATEYAAKKIVFLLAMLEDKDYPEMLKALLAYTDAYQVAKVITTTALSPRTATAEQLAAATKYLPADLVYSYSDRDMALTMSRKICVSEGADCLVVAGSLYHIGAIRSEILGSKND